MGKKIPLKKEKDLKNFYKKILCDKNFKKNLCRDKKFNFFAKSSKKNYFGKKSSKTFFPNTINFQKESNFADDFQDWSAFSHGYIVISRTKLFLTILHPFPPKLRQN